MDTLNIQETDISVAITPFTYWLFTSVIMQFVSHRGLDAVCFVFGKHLIHAWT